MDILGINTGNFYATPLSDVEQSSYKLFPLLPEIEEELLSKIKSMKLTLEQKQIINYRRKLILYLQRLQTYEVMKKQTAQCFLTFLCVAMLYW